ncbi:MAG: UbiA family prenyltransferase, partial [Desulfatiglandales bacterium]|nr:UbiA family prenyltransferase [Desulfatiglandales bacterium]
MEVIGVTAGASTPNWMIKNVVNEIEAIRGRRDSLFGQGIKKVFKFLLLANFLVALGGFALAHAAAILSERRPDLIQPSLAFLYIYSMHVFNRFLDKGASTYNNPEVANFHKRHRTFMILTSLISLVWALLISYYYLGPAFFFALAGISILGIIYNIPIVPMKLRHLWRYSKIKDIPGSKTFSVAFAWGAVITLFPLLATNQGNWPAAFVSFLLIFCLVYIRSALFDIFQVQGDLIVGVETLPITLGEKRTLFLLKAILLSAALLLITAPIFSLMGLFSYLFLIPFIYLAFCLEAYEKKWLHPGPRLEALVEGNFFLAGLMGLIWQILL